MIRPIVSDLDTYVVERFVCGQDDDTKQYCVAQDMYSRKRSSSRYYCSSAASTGSNVSCGSVAWHLRLSTHVIVLFSY